MELNENEPLVSIVVITYNSSKFVIETLDSAKSQTYKNIELIISDDCSKDDTVDVCRKWLNENNDLFVNTELIEASENTGIPGNCNRGLYASNGKWIKMIAGDDILLNNCIEKFINETIKFRLEKFFSSSIYEMKNDVVDRISIPPERIMKGNAAKQKINFLKYLSYIFGPSIFMERDTLLSLGGFDERYQGVEDYPLYLKITKAGYRFQLLNEPTVIYRIHDESITKKINSQFSQSFSKHMEEVAYGMMSEEGMYLWVRHYNLQKNLMISFGNNTILSWKIRMTDPIYWYKKFHYLILGRQFFEKFKSKKIKPILKNTMIEK